MSIPVKFDKVTKARAGLILDHPFFASILLPMPLRYAEDVPTMATDGETIKINPGWTERLTLAETTFVLAHEALHCMFDHMGRRAGRNHNKWNQAADYVINDLLVKEKIGSMPVGGLLNPHLVKEGGGTAEGVYKLLPEGAEKNGAGTPGGAMDDVHDAGSDNGEGQTDEAKMAEKSAQIKVRVIAAKNAAKMQGKLSSNLERLLDEVLAPQVDWKEVLKNFLSEKAKTDYSYARPKRRFLHSDLILPSLSGQKMGKVAIGVDCSGSVDRHMLNVFAAEINGIKQDLLPKEIEVVYFDSEVLDVQVFGEDDDVVLNPRGGGGTDFAPVFQHISEAQEPPIAVVMLTDLVCDSFGNTPGVPVLWAVPDGLLPGYTKVPFGEVLEFGEEK